MTHDSFARIEHEIWIDASPEVVFEYFTDIEMWKRWQAVEGTVDARPGGTLRLRIAGSAIAVGEFVEIDRPRRLVLTWGWEGSGLLPPGSSSVEVGLTEEGTGTRLTLSHRGLPGEEADNMDEGWRHYLARLQKVGAGDDPGPDPWIEDYVDSGTTQPTSEQGVT